MSTPSNPLIQPRNPESITKSTMVRRPRSKIITARDILAHELGKTLLLGHRRRLEEVSKSLSKNPNINIKYLAKRLGVTFKQIQKDVKLLANMGDPAALERLKIHWERADLADEQMRRVEAYVNDNPNATHSSVGEALDLPTERVRQLEVMIKRRVKSFSIKKDRAVIISNTMRKKQILDYLMVQPQATQVEISKDLGIPASTVSRLVDEIDTDMQVDIKAKRTVIMNYILEELLLTKDACDDRLGKIKSPTQGARWMELRIAALKEIRTLMRLGNADMEVNLNLSIDKDQRDAAGNAVAKVIELKNHMTLPDLSAGSIPALPAPTSADDDDAEGDLF